MRIGVTISRGWDDYEAVEDALHAACHTTGNPTGQTVSFPKVTVVHGASQMDWFVAGVAHTLGMSLEAHPADWDRYRSPRGSNPAGMIRNQEMIRAGADVWLAFIKDGSRGASHCAAEAERAGIPTRRYAA
jgi:hypothetical protein